MDFAKETDSILAADEDILLLDVRGLNTVAIQVVGAMSATLQFEGTINGTNWFAINVLPFNLSSVVTAATAAGVWFADVSGLMSIRVRCSSYTSGAPTISLRAVQGGGGNGSGVQMTDEQYAPTYENEAAGKVNVEHTYTHVRRTTEGLVLTGSGFIHLVNISPLTATPTAGLLSIYDNTAESGTILYSEWVFAITPGHTIFINSPVETGVYVGFDAALANVAVSVAYRQGA